MSAAAKPLRVTAAEYLAFDAANEGKHELVNGEIIAMAGASRVHGRVARNVGLALSRAFAGRPCEAFIADLRVAIDETGMYAYPDVVVVCGDQQVADTAPETLLNPTVLIEVLSPSTASYDRGAKAAHYRRRASVTDVVLLDPEDRSVEHYRRLSETDWHLSRTADGELDLQALGARVPLSEIFEGV